MYRSKSGAFCVPACLVRYTLVMKCSHFILSLFNYSPTTYVEYMHDIIKFLLWYYRSLTGLLLKATDAKDSISGFVSQHHMISFRGQPAVAINEIAFLLRPRPDHLRHSYTLLCTYVLYMYIYRYWFIFSMPQTGSGWC